MTITPLPPGVALRPARDEDLGAVESLLTASALPLDGVAEALCGFVVAESDGRLVGVVGLEVCCNYGLLRSTAVDPAWRGRALGRALVERIIAEAEARGIEALYLLTTTADRYFPSFGFARTSRDAVPAEVRATAEFRSACPASATVMRLCLRDDASTPPA
jgi:N-acetylglutamate synthase-like GNAT family acetyltransferase